MAIPGEPGGWSPPIPEGRAAVEAWKGLDRTLRTELLRGGSPSSDPVVTAIAVGYARTMQGPRWWLRAIAEGVGFLVLICVGVIVEVSGAGAPATAVATAVIVVFVLWRQVLAVRRRLALLRMENLNAPALLAAQAAGRVPARPSWPAPAAPGTLTVSYATTALLRLYGTGLLISIAAVPIALLVGWPGLVVPVVVLAVAGAVGSVAALLRTVRGRPVAVLDGAGIELPGYRVRVGWPQVAEVRVLPLRVVAGTRPRNSVAVFILHDPETMIAGLPKRKARAARRSLRHFASPVAVPDQALDRRAEEIAAAANTIASVPVRVFGG